MTNDEFDEAFLKAAKHARLDLVGRRVYKQGLEYESKLVYSGQNTKYPASSQVLDTDRAKEIYEKIYGDDELKPAGEITGSESE